MRLHWLANAGSADSWAAQSLGIFGCHHDEHHVYGPGTAQRVLGQFYSAGVNFPLCDHLQRSRTFPSQLKVFSSQTNWKSREMLLLWRQNFVNFERQETLGFEGIEWRWVELERGEWRWVKVVWVERMWVEVGWVGWMWCWRCCGAETFPTTASSCTAYSSKL